MHTHYGLLRVCSCVHTPCHATRARRGYEYDDGFGEGGDEDNPERHPAVRGYREQFKVRLLA